MNKRIKSFFYAGRGIKMVCTEPNMRIHLFATLLVIVCGFIFKITLTEWILCLLCIGSVLSMEMINSAIEKVIDLVSPNLHPLAGKAKDIAAGAVLVFAIISAIIGVLIFVPKIYELL